MKFERRILKINETVVTVISEGKFIPVAQEEIFFQRSLLEDYIKNDPAFVFTLKPYPVPDDAPEIVKKMADAGEKAGVGPMAAVAGAIAEFALKAMLKEGATHAIVDNGGDIAMFISEPVIIGIYTGRDETSHFGLKFLPSQRVIGVCTSSGTVGHSVNFGRADAAVVISEDVVLADAVATALGNKVNGESKKVLKEAIESTLIPGIEAMLVIVGGLFGMAGDLPEMVVVNTNPEIITKG